MYGYVGTIAKVNTNHFLFFLHFIFLQVMRFIVFLLLLRHCLCRLHVFFPQKMEDSLVCMLSSKTYMERPSLKE